MAQRFPWIANYPMGPVTSKPSLGWHRATKITCGFDPALAPVRTDDTAAPPESGKIHRVAGAGLQATHHGVVRLADSLGSRIV